MKLNTLLAVPALLGALLLTACGEKAAETTDAATGAATEALDAAGAATDAAPAAPDAAATTTEAAPAAAQADTAGGGGYEPTAEERIPGETRAADAAPAAEAAPAEAAPVEAAPANQLKGLLQKKRTLGALFL